MTQRKIAQILGQYTQGDKTSTNPYSKAGLYRVNATLNLGEDIVKFTQLSAGSTLPNELRVGRTIIPAGTPLTQTHIDNMTFDSYLRAANRFDSAREYDEIVDRHKENHQEFLKAITETQFNVMGRVNETIVRVCKALGLNIYSPDIVALLEGSECNRLKGRDKVAFDNQEFIDKLIEHVVAKAENILEADTSDKLKEYRRDVDKGILEFWATIAEGGREVNSDAKKEITAAMKKLGYAQSVGSLFQSLKDGKRGRSIDIEYSLPKAALNTAINSSKIAAERELMATLARNGLHMTNLMCVVDGEETRLGDMVETMVTGIRGNAVSAIVREGIEKKRGITIAFDKKLLEQGDCTLTEEHKKNWKKTEKAEYKAGGQSNYPPITKPPYRGLCQILKMLDHLTKAMTTGFQKTTLADAWYKRRNRQELKVVSDKGYEWGDKEIDLTVEILNDPKRFREMVAKNPRLEQLRQQYADAVDKNEVSANGILQDIAEMMGVVSRPAEPTLAERAAERARKAEEARREREARAEAERRRQATFDRKPARNSEVEAFERGVLDAAWYKRKGRPIENLEPEPVMSPVDEENERIQQEEERKQKETDKRRKEDQRRLTPLNPDTPAEWKLWGERSNTEDKDLAGICRLMLRFGNLERVDLAAEEQRMDKMQDERTLTEEQEKSFDDKVNRNISRHHAVVGVQGQITNKSLGSKADKEAAVYRAIGLQGEAPREYIGRHLTGITQVLERVCARAVSGNEKAVIRFKVILGMDPEAPIPYSQIKFGDFARAMGLAQSGNIFAFMQELDNQRMAYERLAENEQARHRGGNTLGL